MTTDLFRSRAAKSIFQNPLSFRQTVSTSTQDGSQASTKRRYTQKTLSRSSSNLVVVPEGGRDAGMLETTQLHNNQTINVILTGETGVGKSAVVNLIAQCEVAKVSSDVNICTLHSTRYNFPFAGMIFSIFDTTGLEGPTIGANDYLRALRKAYELILILGAAGGVHLLLFTMRGGPLTATTLSNYRLFSEVAFQAKVPLALVFTGLEGEVEMEDWWMRNKSALESYGIKGHDHVCITTVQGVSPGEDLQYMESQKKIRELLKSYSLKTFVHAPDDLFLRLGMGMPGFIEKHRKPRRKGIANVLSRRLQLDSETAKRLLDMTERGDAEPSSRDGEDAPQDAPLARIEDQDSEGEADNTKSDATMKSRDLDAGEWSDGLRQAGVPDTATSDAGKPNDAPLKRATDEVTVNMAQSLELIPVEEDNSGKSEDEVQDRVKRAGNVNAESQKVNAPMKKCLERETSTLMDDIRSNFAPDLTGHVTKSSNFPFASGGFGDIYRGKLNLSEKSADVAIKTYKVYLQHDEHLREKMKRFRREIRVWVRLEHPNVLPLFGTIRDSNMNPDIPAMVCPWVENGSLSTYLERNEDLTEAKRFVLVNDVAHGLQYLHSQHVVHGDLSGSNVLVHADGRACIADFGLSTLLTRLGGSTFATTRHNKGTARWMAPELLDLDDSQTAPTMQSDVYSFGSIMLQIMTGDIPYHYFARDAQVIRAIAVGVGPKRPIQTVVTDSRWAFIEWCWSPVDAAISRPSSDQIVAFTEKELAEVTAGEV